MHHSTAALPIRDPWNLSKQIVKRIRCQNGSLPIIWAKLVDEVHQIAILWLRLAGLTVATSRGSIKKQRVWSFLVSCCHSIPFRVSQNLRGLSMLGRFLFKGFSLNCSQSVWGTTASNVRRKKITRRMGQAERNGGISKEPHPTELSYLYVPLPCVVSYYRTLNTERDCRWSSLWVILVWSQEMTIEPGLAIDVLWPRLWNKPATATLYTFQPGNNESK